MDLHLSLINGRHRDEAVKRVADHLETMFWPSVLSSTLEDLLISQMLRLKIYLFALKKARIIEALNLNGT